MGGSEHTSGGWGRFLNTGNTSICLMRLHGSLATFIFIYELITSKILLN